jgi:hypothetical protein
MGPKDSQQSGTGFCPKQGRKENVIHRTDIYSNARTVEHDGEYHYLFLPVTICLSYIYIPPLRIPLLISHFLSILLSFTSLSFLPLLHRHLPHFLPFQYPVPTFISFSFFSRIPVASLSYFHHIFTHLPVSQHRCIWVS